MLIALNGGGAELFSRRDLRYRQFADLCSELSLDLNADDAVLDGEIVKLDENGCPIFVALMRRRAPFQFVAGRSLPAVRGSRPSGPTAAIRGGRALSNKSTPSA